MPSDLTIALQTYENYADYVAAQEEANRSKLAWTWVRRENVRFISRRLRSHLKRVEAGICHGTRRGKEQRWFRKDLGADVIGTEIASTASQFPNTVQWDFHESRPDWSGRFDFVYSNSLDHAYDPEKAVRTWFGQLRHGGVLVLEHGDSHGPDHTNRWDPFGVDYETLVQLVTEWAEPCSVVSYKAPDERREHTKILFAWRWL